MNQQKPSYLLDVSFSSAWDLMISDSRTADDGGLVAMCFVHHALKQS